MRSSLLFFFIFLIIPDGIAQPKCKTTLPSDVKICGMHPRVTDSATICTPGIAQLLPADTTLKIVSFVLSVGGTAFDGDIIEIPVMGNILNGHCIYYLRTIQSGSYIEIGCIKAVTKSGRAVYLNTYFREF